MCYLYCLKAKIYSVDEGKAAGFFIRVKLRRRGFLSIYTLYIHKYIFFLGISFCVCAVQYLCGYLWVYRIHFGCFVSWARFWWIVCREIAQTVLVYYVFISKSLCLCTNGCCLVIALWLALHKTNKNRYTPIPIYINGHHGLL